MPEPITRLFLSADIAGSTAYKQRKMNDDDVSWPSIFIQFFQGLPGTFRSELSIVEQTVAGLYTGFSKAKDPEMWKAIGDELVFWQEVRDEYQVAVSVSAWAKALQEFRQSLKKESLDVKGAAWLGSFPYPNREIAIPRTLSAAKAPDQPVSANEANLQREDCIRDFIGPHIDAGFRIAGKSSTRKMCVSIDVAEVVASVATHLPECSLHYEGTTELKGVHSGRPYPIFWVDCDPQDGFAKAEDQLDGKAPAKPENVISLAKFSLQHAGASHVWLPDAINARFKQSDTKIRELTDQIDKHCGEFPELPADHLGEAIESAVGPSVEPDLSAKVSELHRTP
jgi:hypothetical protein